MALLLQRPALIMAVRRHAATTPDTVMTFPSIRWVRFISPITLEYSAVWIFARSDVRFLTLGFPVTAPTRGKLLKCHTAHSMACSSSIESASSVSMISPWLMARARFRPFALPRFFSSFRIRSFGYSSVSPSRTSCVPSVLASFITMTSSCLYLLAKIE